MALTVKEKLLIGGTSIMALLGIAAIYFYKKEDIVLANVTSKPKTQKQASPSSADCPAGFVMIDGICMPIGLSGELGALSTF